MNERKELCRMATEKWGPWLQIIVLMEECGELIQALSKHIRYGARPIEKDKEKVKELEKKVIKEAEDVRLMIDQIEYGIIRDPKLWAEGRLKVFNDFKLLLNGQMRGR